MIASAKLSYLRIAPRKVRLVVDLVRGKTTEESQNILKFTIKKPSLAILKLLNQAIANAKNTLQLDPANLYISKITVDEGPKLKRWQPRGRGRAYEIQKKTSHITIILDEIKKGKKKVKRAKKTKEAEVAEKTEESQKEIPKAEKPKFRPKAEVAKPKLDTGLRKVFRRKAF